jgi:hypothetical protein
MSSINLVSRAQSKGKSQVEKPKIISPLSDLKFLSQAVKRSFKLTVTGSIRANRKQKRMLKCKSAKSTSRVVN